MYPVSEADRRLHCLELKAYDHTLRFGKSFNGFESVGNAGAFLELCCKACGVEMEDTQGEIEGMPNGREMLSIYNEGVSILEDAARIGLSVPEKLKGVLAQLREEKGKEQETVQRIRAVGFL